MFSNLSRWLTYLLAILYAILGALLFLLPERLAPVFAWKVTPFMTMNIGAPGTKGGIFPEVMSLFTLRSFGMFHLTLALAVVPFLWNKNLNAILYHSVVSYGLILFITLAAFVYLGLFDFANKPAGLLYFLAYLVVGIPLIFVFRKLGTGASQ
jgi:hypothetical protein